MTHIYFITRAGIAETEFLKANLQSQMFSWTRKNLETGQEEPFAVQGKLREVKLWEYVVPDEHVAEVCFYLGFKGDGNHVHKKDVGLQAWALKKALHLDPIPKFNVDTLKVSPRLIYRAFCTIYPLGIKKDEVKDFEQWGYNQEAL